MDLNLVHLIFSLTIDGTVSDRFALFRLRRFIPVELRRATCGRTIPCGECMDAAGCPWFPLFGQPLSSDPATVKRHQKPPLPFVFDIPFLTPGRADVADAEIGLTLVGNAVPSADRFIVAVTRMLEGELHGSDPAVSLDCVASGTLSGDRAPVIPSKGGDVLGNLRILSAQDVGGGTKGSEGTVNLQLLTPLRLFHEGKLQRRLDGSVFLRGLIRRVSSLAAMYGGSEMEDDFRWLAERSRGVRLHDAEFLYDDGGGHSSAGVMGKGSFEGDLDPFLPYLFIGEYLHAGKGASWGFGRYRLG